MTTIMTTNDDGNDDINGSIQGDINDDNNDNNDDNESNIGRDERKDSDIGVCEFACVCMCACDKCEGVCIWASLSVKMPREKLTSA